MLLSDGDAQHHASSSSYPRRPTTTCSGRRELWQHGLLQKRRAVRSSQLLLPVHKGRVRVEAFPLTLAYNLGRCRVAQQVDIERHYVSGLVWDRELGKVVQWLCGLVDY